MSKPSSRPSRRKKPRTKKHRSARRPPTPPPRVPGHAAMPFEAWSDWRQVAETFVAERPPADPALIVEALVLVLARVSSWSDFLGGRWVHHAPTELYVHYVPGFRAGRTYHLLDRLVHWLHERGDLDDWQRDVLWTAIDDGREAHRLAPARTERVEELCLDDFVRQRLASEYAATLDDPALRTRVPDLFDFLTTALETQHGPSAAPPLGALDPDALIVDLLERSATPATERRLADRAASIGAFYAWLGQTRRLEPARAAALAERLAAGAVGLAATVAVPAA